MNRAEFMRQLESLLQKIPATEREEALQYYNDYFDDAGEENEQAVIEALGNPARVAENIRRDLLGNGYGEVLSGKVLASDRKMIEYGKSDTQPTVSQDCELPVEVSGAVSDASGEMDSEAGSLSAAMSGAASSSRASAKPGWLWALLVVLAVFAAPVLLGILCAVIGVIVSWFAVIFSFGMVTLACFIVLVVLAIVGTMCLFADPLSGIALIGGSLICGSAGVLFLMLTVVMAGIITPAIFKGIAFLCRKLIQCKRI